MNLPTIKQASLWIAAFYAKILITHLSSTSYHLHHIH